MILQSLGSAWKGANDVPVVNAGTWTVTLLTFNKIIHGGHGATWE